MGKFVSHLIFIFRIDILTRKISTWFNQANAKRLSKKYNTPIRYIEQGTGGLEITSSNQKNASFKIDKTSHLKSNTYIECSGGVSIGKYFHTGRNLTIFSTNHNYDSTISIPYDEIEVCKPVIIGDFVWFGSNVTVVPGVHVGEGVVVGSGAVLTKDIPAYSVVGGNPAKIIKTRNIEVFEKLKSAEQYY